ncbi:MAG: adenylate/guanylate cyclase domain-containing protein, partial [Bacteroidota bacterium]
MKEFKRSDSPEIVANYLRVTVIFVIFHNFDHIAEKLNNIEIVELLHSFFSYFDAQCSVFRIQKIETVGPVYMAVSGCPERSLQSEMNAVHFAQAILHAPQDLQERLFARLGPIEMLKHLKLQIGLAAGPVIGGVIGRSCPRFKLIGDTVNTASRMESTSPPAAIQITQEVYSRLEETEQALFAKRKPFWVKGKGRMQTYLSSQKPKEAQRERRRSATFITIDNQINPEGELQQNENQEEEGDHKSTLADDIRRKQALPAGMVASILVGPSSIVFLSPQERAMEHLYTNRIACLCIGKLRILSLLLMMATLLFLTYVTIRQNGHLSFFLICLILALLSAGAASYAVTFSQMVVLKLEISLMVVGTFLAVLIAFITIAFSPNISFGIFCLVLVALYQFDCVRLCWRIFLALISSFFYLFLLHALITNFEVSSSSAFCSSSATPARIW